MNAKHALSVLIALSLSLTLAACAPSTTPDASSGASSEPTAPASSAPAATDTPAPTDAATPTPEPATPTPAAVSRFGVDDVDIAGLRIGTSTYDDVIAAFGKPTEESDESQGATTLRSMKYDGMYITCTSEDGKSFTLTNLFLDSLPQYEGPRGIRVGMTRAELEALFPREMDEGRTEGNAEYLYAEGIATDAPEGLDGYYPPFGYIEFEPDEDDMGVYTFMAPLDGVTASFAYTRERQLMLTVGFNEGKVTSFGLFVGVLGE